MPDHCPGAANLRTPALSIMKCPQCGGEVELFSNDLSVKCSTCGFMVCNDIESCIPWCRYQRNVVVSRCTGNLGNERIFPIRSRERPILF